MLVFWFLLLFDYLCLVDLFWWLVLLVVVLGICCLLYSFKLFVRVAVCGLFRFLWLLCYYAGLLCACVVGLFWLFIIVCLGFGWCACCVI